MTQKSQQKHHYIVRYWLLALASAVVVFVALSAIKSVSLAVALFVAVAVVIVGSIWLKLTK